MSKGFYWLLLVGALLFALAGRYVLFSLPVPDTADIELRRVEDFYNSQIWIALGMGAALGVLAGFSATRSVRHQPSDDGSSYLGRVVSYGVMAALGAVAIVLIAEMIAAALWSIEPLAPLEKVMLLVPSGYFLVLLATAFGTALFAYFVVTRARSWGGQYALMPAPKS